MFVTDGDGKAVEKFNSSNRTLATSKTTFCTQDDGFGKQSIDIRR